MEPIFWEWINFSLRWLHVVAAIAWIGSSFYFIHLDASLRRRDGLPPGVSGEAWQVHGGGFYHMMKYQVAPDTLPEHLTWFKWEAYTTWISGFFLLCVLYYRGADLFLVDPATMPLDDWQAIAISVASILLGWVVYDGLCRSPVGRDDTRLAIVGFVFLVASAWGFAQVFSGRGALLQAGALIGTIMVANVAHVIIPKQRIVVADLLAGRTPDPALGKAAKQRSLHNNYLTLPVVFLMLSNHYPTSFGTRYNWVIVGVVLIVGTAIRHFFNSRHAGRPSPWWTWAVAVAGMLAVVWLASAGPRDTASAMAAPVDVDARFAAVEDIVISRCSMCHAESPVWDGLAAAPRGVRLDTAAEIRRHAEPIRLQAVLSHAMPPGNVTGLSADERKVLAAWTADPR